MDPMRLCFSDLSSDSDTNIFRHSRSPEPELNLILRLSTSFSPVSATSDPPANENLENNAPYPIIEPQSVNSEDPRHSSATAVSGTTVWTAQGSARTTMGVGNSGKTAGTNSNENTENIANAALKLRRRTVETLPSSQNDHRDHRSLTPTENFSQPINLSQRTMAIADDTEELPPTQPRGPLKDVMAYVEVHSGRDNRSAVVGNVLRDLGAAVCQRFTNKVTHVVFREGRQSTLEKARAKNIHLVSVLWIDACQRQNAKVQESDYPISLQEMQTPWALGKKRRLPSMQPKPMELELALTDEAIRKRRKRLEAARLKREIIKDIRSGKFNVTAPPTTSTGEELDYDMPPEQIFYHPPLSLSTDANFWNSFVTPNPIQQEAAIVVDIPETPGSQNVLSSQGSLEDSVRRRLFDMGGTVNGSPTHQSTSNVGTENIESSDRMVTRSASTRKASAAPSATRAPKRRSSDENGPGSSPLLPPAIRPRTAASTIDEVIESVCAEVGRSQMQNTRGGTRRRLIDPNVVHSAMDSPADSTSLTPRTASGTSGNAGKNGEPVRLRSSAFKVKSTFDFIGQLQATRRSSDDFVPVTAAAVRKKKRQKKVVSKAKARIDVTVRVNPAEKRPKSRYQWNGSATRGLVLTSVTQEDRELIYAITKRLKGFRIERKVTANTTHVICGSNQRTLNVLMAVARGCWILPVSWVYYSLANDSWIAEEEFELTDWFPGARVARKRNRSVPGPAALVTCTIFDVIGSFYVGQLSQPPMVDLGMLIKWCGGRISLSSRRATYCIGCTATHDGAIGVKETWILDSLMAHELLPITDYLIQ